MTAGTTGAICPVRVTRCHSPMCCRCASATSATGCCSAHGDPQPWSRTPAMGARPGAKAPKQTRLTDLSVRAAALKNRRDRPEEHSDVEGQRPVLDVLQIEPNSVLPRKVATPADLPQ